MSTTTYTEVAHANGSWISRVLLPETPFEAVCELLKDLTRYSGTPITAFLFGDAADPVDELMLARDPSRTHGCPAVREYELLTTRLTTDTGWPVARAPRTGILVGLGLREGFEPDAPQHSLAEVEQRLAEHGTGWRCRTARLVSARLVGADTVQWYEEVGAVVEAPAEMMAIVEQLAGAFRQDRFVITNFETGWTRALANG